MTLKIEVASDGETATFRSVGRSTRITWSSCRPRCSGTVHGSCSTWQRRHSWISRWCASWSRMKGPASSCCAARHTSGSGSLGSGATEPKDIDHDHFTRTSPPGSARQPARFGQCEKRDDPGRHLRLAQRGQPGAQALSALNRDEPRARSHSPRLRRDWAGVGDEGLRGPRGPGSGRQGRDVRLVHVSRAPVRPGNHFALFAPREGERRKNSLRPVSRGHVRYLGNPRASAILTMRRLEHSTRLGATMNRDLGVWTDQDCALVLIDYQKAIFATIRSETSADLEERNASLLARTAIACNMLIVLSTVGVAARINGPTQPAILAELPGVQVIDRTTMNAFEDRAFREAVKKTGRKRLIFGGLHTEICLTSAAVQALKDGYQTMFVTDAVGGRSQTAHRTA